MYHAPGKKREFNAFVLDKTYFGPYDETTCIDWTDDSRCGLGGVGGARPERGPLDGSPCLGPAASFCSGILASFGAGCCLHHRDWLGDWSSLRGSEVRAVAEPPAPAPPFHLLVPEAGNAAVGSGSVWEA